MKKKGFTLVELLAVIVILSIIALITIPIISNVIEKSKKGAAKSSALGYIDAVEKTIAVNMLDSNKTNIVDNVYQTVDLEQAEYALSVNGEKPKEGSWLKVEKGRVVSYSFKIGGYIITYDRTSNELTVEKGDTVADIPAPAPVSFASDSWKTIQKAVQSGSYPYEVGDIKVITIAAHTNDCASYTGDGASYVCNSEEVASKEVTVRVANTEECTNGETSQTACGFVVEFVDIIENHNYNDADSTNTSGTNVGGWPASKLREYINSTIYNALPSDLQSVIADTTVVSSHGSTSGEENFTSTDKLYLLSSKEVWGKEGTSNTISWDTAESETRQLDYYANYENEDGTKGVTTSNYSGAIKQYSGTNSYWWLRSARSDYSRRFYIVTSTGDWSSYDAFHTRGVSPAFRIE